MRIATLALAMAVALGFAVVELGCAGPYSEKPERLSKPRKKKKPEPTEEELAAQEAVFDDKCRTNFFTDPTTSRRVGVGRSLTKQAEGLLVEADDQDGAMRVATVKDALSKLRNALNADPYGPEPTYKMAVAYAMVGKKGCSIALLERLQELTKHPQAGAEADRVINRALRDQSFDPFRKDADAALGR